MHPYPEANRNGENVAILPLNPRIIVYVVHALEEIVVHKGRVKFPTPGHLKALVHALKNLEFKGNANLPKKRKKLHYVAGNRKPWHLSRVPPRSLPHKRLPGNSLPAKKPNAHYPAGIGKGKPQPARILAPDGLENAVPRVAQGPLPQRIPKRIPRYVPQVPLRRKVAEQKPRIVRNLPPKFFVHVIKGLYPLNVAHNGNSLSFADEVPLLFRKIVIAVGWNSVNPGENIVAVKEIFPEHRAQGSIHLPLYLGVNAGKVNLVAGHVVDRLLPVPLHRP